MNQDTVNKYYLTSTVLEKQEHLSVEQLKMLSPKYSSIDHNNMRPKSSFIDLMNWAAAEFGKDLTNSKLDKDVLNKFVHNRIVIDGQFLHYCSLSKITVQCLYKDSIVSWNSNSNYEKFFAQGVFLIKSKDVEFLQCSLFHKGNQNEDEISFFILVSNSNYEKYLQLRNSFDEWTVQRDRSNLHVRVIDGSDVPYTKSDSWDDLFLPDSIKNDIRNLVTNFLSSENFYKENKIPWKRGFLLFGKPGCGKSKCIKTIMSEFNFKPVTIASGASDEAIREAFNYAETQSPSLLYFEDLDSMFERGVDISNFLNLMDGISSKNGLLVIATANDIKKLKSNITDRPSRFDRKFEIPLPDNNMAHSYLKKWFGKLLNVKKGRELAKYSEKYEFSYASLKELYISSMFEALSHNRKTPTEKDIDNALSRLVKDKNILNGGSPINTDKYFK